MGSPTHQWAHSRRHPGRSPRVGNWGRRKHDVFANSTRPGALYQCAVSVPMATEAGGRRVPLDELVPLQRQWCQEGTVAS